MQLTCAATYSISRPSNINRIPEAVTGDFQKKWRSFATHPRITRQHPRKRVFQWSQRGRVPPTPKRQIMKGKIGTTHLQANRRTVGTTIHMMCRSAERRFPICVTNPDQSATARCVEDPLHRPGNQWNHQFTRHPRHSAKSAHDASKPTHPVDPEVGPSQDLRARAGTGRDLRA
jgi:hypothetical protein